MDVEVTYNSNGNAIVIKPKTVTYIADNLVTPQELIDCYGSRISVMSPKLVEQIIKEEAAKCPVEGTSEVVVEPTKEPEAPTVTADETTTTVVEGEGTTVDEDNTTVTVAEGTTEPTKEPEAPKPTKESVAKQTKKTATKKASNKKNK